MMAKNFPLKMYICMQETFVFVDSIYLITSVLFMRQMEIDLI